MRYADLDLLIADYLPEVKSQKEKDALGRILDSVSAFVDLYCKRTPNYFAPSSADPSMKRIRGEGQSFLRLPVHVFNSIQSVLYDGHVIDPAHVYESEKNGWLYFEDDCWIFSEGSLCKIMARWGYEATPLPVVEAVRLITVRIWETQNGTIGQLTPQGFIQERLIPTAAKDFLKPFIKRQFEI